VFDIEILQKIGNRNNNPQVHTPPVLGKPKKGDGFQQFAVAQWRCWGTPSRAALIQISKPSESTIYPGRPMR